MRHPVEAALASCKALWTPTNNQLVFSGKACETSRTLTNCFVLSLCRQLCQNAPRLPLKDNQTANVLVFRRWSEKLRRERGLETAWSANWISPSEMTRSKKWNVILAHAGRNAKHVNVKSNFSSLSLSSPLLFFLRWLFLLYHDVSDINHAARMRTSRLQTLRDIQTRALRRVVQLFPDCVTAPAARTNQLPAAEKTLQNSDSQFRNDWCKPGQKTGLSPGNNAIKRD